jgi:hypothetical protein
MSYSEELTKEIVDEYKANPCRETVDTIAARVGKSARSVIAKLASEGVYYTPERTTKTGEPIVKKDELVADINLWLEIETPTLAKTSKLELKALHGKIQELINARSVSQSNVDC